MSNIKNITVDQGSTYSYTFNLFDKNNNIYDLTGYDAHLTVRYNYGDTVPFILATVALGNIVITTGAVTVNLTPADTANTKYAAKDDGYIDCVYDLEIISPLAKIYKPARGTFTINRKVTS